MGNFGVFVRTAAVLLVFQLFEVLCDITDGNTEHLKREHSLMKPYQGNTWDFWGSTLVTSSYVRLTSDEKSKQGSIWNTVPCHLKDWEMHVQFKIHGSGKKSLHGDGIALWYTKDKLHPGPVFSNNAQFHGLAVFVDTYSNDDATDRSFPFISAMVNNGSVNYDHGKDGAPRSWGAARLRSETKITTRTSPSDTPRGGSPYLMIDVEDKNEWRECIDIGGVRLPTDISSERQQLQEIYNHDIISMKMYQLMSAPWWERWFSRRDRRGTRGFTEERNNVLFDVE
ncbi:hypothetical protein F7725_010629 [Dissostichus mawsoni]|uniref:L-type lectin-like domain-containing protein n=1 Tax=Dissostichus mawsoni TaxID=36200 RepID=A0A7J5XPJ1_DISMA|nr:hypothetical protein F7725_010629 [Dissostichus mawsoni]